MPVLKAANWRVRYYWSKSSGLRLGVCDYGEQRIIHSAAVPFVYVNYWGNLGSQGYNFQAGSNQNEVITSQISLVFNENTVNERRETFVVPLRTIGELLPVKSFNY